MEDFESAKDELLQRASESLDLLATVYGGLPVPIVIAVGNPLSIERAMASLERAAEDVQDWPVSDLVRDALHQASWHWIGGTILTGFFLEKKSRRFLTAASLSFFQVAVALGAAVADMNGQLPGIPPQRDGNDEDSEG